MEDTIVVRATMPVQRTNPNKEVAPHVQPSYTMTADDYAQLQEVIAQIKLLNERRVSEYLSPTHPQIPKRAKVTPDTFRLLQRELINGAQKSPTSTIDMDTATNGTPPLLLRQSDDHQVVKPPDPITATSKVDQ